MRSTPKKDVSCAECGRPLVRTEAYLARVGFVTCSIPCRMRYIHRHFKKAIPDAERFWRHVTPDQTGCWLWTRATYGFGYGRVRAFGKTMDTHRAAWLLT